MKLCSLLFLLRDNEILLAMKKRGFGADRWNGVGGKLEPGETLEQAMVRETEEEIGVTPLTYRKMAIHDFVFESGIPDMQVHSFLCDSWQGEPTETEEMAPRWFKLADIPYDDMWEDDLLWLPLVLKAKLLHTRFVFAEGDRMVSAQIDIVKELPL